MKLGWRAYCVFFAMVLGIFIPCFITTSVVNAMVPIRNQMHLTPTDLQWIVNAYMVAVLACIVITGVLGDRFGKRTLFYYGSIVLAIGLILSAVSPGITLLLVGRALQGIGASILMPGTLALMSAFFPKEKQAVVNIGWAVGIAFGFGMGPFISGVVCSTVGWPYLFWVTLGVLIISNILMFIADHRDENKSPMQLDYIGLFVYFCAMLPFAYGVTNSTQWGWSDGKTLGLVFGGLAFFILLYVLSKRVNKAPLINFAHFNNPQFLIACIGMLVNGFTIMGLYFYLGLYLQDPLLGNQPVLQAGVDLMPAGAGLLIGSILAPYVRKWIGFWNTSILTKLIFMAPFVWFILITPPSAEIILWMPLMIGGIGLGMANATFPRIAIEVITGAETSRVSSIVNLNLYLGAMISTALGSVLLLRTSTSRLFASLSQINLFPQDKPVLIKALYGHIDLLKTLQHYTLTERHQIYEGVLHSAWYGLQWAFGLCLIVAGVGLILSILLSIKAKAQGVAVD